MLYRLLLILICCPFIAAAQDNQMPFKPEGDSLIPFEPHAKTWYVQTLEEIHPETKIIKTNSPRVNIVTYVTEIHRQGPTYYYLLAQQQKYSWKITAFDLGYDCSIDTTYFKEINGKGNPELVVEWTYRLGASGQEFSWNELQRGLVVFDLETSTVILNQTTLWEENHYGSSTNEELLQKPGSYFDEAGRWITNQDEQHAVEMKYRQEIFFDKGTLTIVLKAFDPNNPAKVIRQWTDNRYAFTSKGWKKIH